MLSPLFALLLWPSFDSISSAEMPEPPPASCFACRMRVLTPYGYVELSKLQPGELIMSWDENSRQLTLNRVRNIHLSRDQVYGDLNLPDLPQSIEVTPDHPFYLPEEGIYLPISEIAPHQKLLVIRVDDEGGCGSLLTERGQFNKGGIGKVMNLDLELQPHNFVVEGVVVYRKAPSIVADPAGEQ